MSDATDRFDPDPFDPGAFDEARLGGHTIDELEEYLDRGRSPADPSIDASPECQLALAALERLRGVSHSLIETEAEAQEEPSENWMRALFGTIAREVRAGRDIPLAHPDPAVDLSISEGSVRSLIRAAGDSVPGALLGRCALDGDVTEPGHPIRVAVSVTALAPVSLRELAERVRSSVRAALERHTELAVTAIDVRIDDVHAEMLPMRRNGGSE